MTDSASKRRSAGKRAEGRARAAQADEDRTDATLFDPELADLPPEIRWREWMSRVEAVLFAAPQPVERPALARVVGRDASLDLLIDDIREDLRGRPYDIVSVAGGWQLRTRAAYADAINAALAVGMRPVGFTRTELLVLVSIAYHQPVTRAGVSTIIGYEISRDMIASLRDKAMITAGPRSPTPGAPFSYVTTRRFLEHFGLDTLRDLPELEALQDAQLSDGGGSDQMRALLTGRVVADGSPQAVMTAANMEEVFGVAGVVVPDPVVGSPMFVPGRRSSAATSK